MDRYLVAERDLSAHDTASGRLNGMSASELKSAGEIKGYSAGINEHPMIGRFLERMELDFFPWMPGTLLDRSPLHDGFPRCVTCGIGIVIGSPCASGILATGPTDEARYNDAPATLEILEKTGRIEAVCRRHGVPLPAAAPQFPLGHPGAGGFVAPRQVQDVNRATRSGH